MDEDGEECILSFTKQDVDVIAQGKSPTSKSKQREESEEEEESALQPVTNSSTKPTLKKKKITLRAGGNEHPETYPKHEEGDDSASSLNVSQSVANRALGDGEGLVGGDGAAALTRAIFNHEIDFLKESVTHL
jgi:hypothetical protein